MKRTNKTILLIAIIAALILSAFNICTAKAQSTSAEDYNMVINYVYKNTVYRNITIDDVKTLSYGCSYGIVGIGETSEYLIIEATDCEGMRIQILDANGDILYNKFVLSKSKKYYIPNEPLLFIKVNHALLTYTTGKLSSCINLYFIEKR